MELVILSIGLLCITFWEYFSHIFGKLARILVVALFVGLSLSALAVMFYLDGRIASLIIFLVAVVLFVDFRRIYKNYGFCGNVFTFYNKEIFKVATLILCMSLASQYATYVLFRKDDIATLFFCLAMTGFVAINDAARQFSYNSGFEGSDDDLELVGYVVGYQGKKVLGGIKLVIEVDLDEAARNNPWGTAWGFNKSDVRCANKMATIDAKAEGRIVYYITGMRYDMATYYVGREFHMRYSEPKKVLYVEDELDNNKTGLLICIAVGLFAFFACLTYLVRNL
ncbi:MAG: hypothetical protein IJB96_02635 [Lachnospira sp.]|nr:hypothetical protein [Lachnospira sp.]